MKYKKTYIVPHRRRREGKTDYRLRLKLLLSKKPRLVIRRSLNNMICQIVNFDPKGDKTIVFADCCDLKKFGWKINSGNIPAAYLIGLIAGLKAKKAKIKEAVLDIGLNVSTKESRIYAALKGFLESGINVPHSEEILPKEERVKGEHIAKYAEKLKKENLNEYKKRFSVYLKNKINPEDLPKEFERVKNNIMKNLK